MNFDWLFSETAGASLKTKMKLICEFLDQATFL